MKKKTLVIMNFLLLGYTIALAQCPADGDYKLKNQEEVDAFCSMMASGCIINGKVEIDRMGGGSDITDLSGLSCLAGVTGDFKLKETQLTDLSGLANLTSVGGDFKIEDNLNLSSLNGLNSSLSSIGNELKIKGNDVLTDVSGLGNITSVGGNFKFEDNPMLGNLNGINVTTVGGELKIKNNNVLTDISGLGSITTINGNLKFENNDQLTNLDGFNSSLTTIDGEVLIKDNDLLSDIKGLRKITNVTGNFKVENNMALTNLDSLDLMMVGGELKIKDNLNLINVNGLSELTTVGTKLKIEDNDKLENLNGLSGITSVGEEVKVTDNDILGNSGVEDCINGGLCGAIGDGSGLTLDFDNNAAACNLSDMLVVNSCDNLPVELGNFKASIQANSMILVSWETFSEINNDYFEIQHSVDGQYFEKLGQVVGGGTSSNILPYSFLHENPNMGINYYRLKQVDFDGTVEISPIISQLIESSSGLKIFPNPTSGLIQLQLSELTEAKLTLRESNGKILSQQFISNNQELDLSAYNGGLYILEVFTGNKKEYYRIIKF